MITFKLLHLGLIACKLAAFFVIAGQGQISSSTVKGDDGCENIRFVLSCSL